MNHGHIHKHENERRGIVGVIREETVDRIHWKSSNIYSKVGKISVIKRLSGVLINPRSIRNKFGELQVLVTVKSWDIIAITETWIHSQHRDFIGEFRLNCYCLFNNNRINKEGGGVLLYYRNPKTNWNKFSD